MAGRWEDPQPATEPVHVLDDAATWLLVMMLLLIAAPLALGLS